MGCSREGPEIQIGRLPGTVHGPAVRAGNGYGAGAPPAVGSERGLCLPASRDIGRSISNLQGAVRNVTAQLF